MHGVFRVIVGILIILAIFAVSAIGAAITTIVVSLAGNYLLVNVVETEPLSLWAWFAILVLFGLLVQGAKA